MPRQPSRRSPKSSSASCSAAYCSRGKKLSAGDRSSVYLERRKQCLEPLWLSACELLEILDRVAEH